MEQIKHLNKLFKETFHITDMKTHPNSGDIFSNKWYATIMCFYIYDVKFLFESFIYKFNLFHCSSGSDVKILFHLQLNISPLLIS